jgi:trans-aconitate 2-methyltransferase
LRHRIKGSWDAHAYDQISYPVQYRWGQQVIEWRRWNGNEVVMDAGCGTGLLTRELAKKVPRGKVYAVDIDSNMIQQAMTNLQFFDNVEIVQSSFTDVKLARKVDVIFSNSAFHWVQDHGKAFQSFWEILKPSKIHKGDDSNYASQTDSSGQLLIQCGAYGNLQDIITVLERIAYSHQFYAYFTDWEQPWHFAKPDETDKLLEEAGYVNRNVHSTKDHAVFPNRNVYAKFIKTVIMKSYLEQLSLSSNDNNTNDNEKLKALFFDMFLNEIKKYSNRLGEQWRLDFIRLNIIAHTP